MKSHILGFTAVLLWLLISSSVQGAVIPISCLTTTDTRVILTNLRSYTVQHKPLFPVNALRFLTIKGKIICSDPSSPWAIRAKKYLDSKNKKANISAHQAVTVVPLNASTTNKTQ